MTADRRRLTAEVCFGGGQPSAVGGQRVAMATGQPLKYTLQQPWYDN